MVAASLPSFAPGLPAARVDASLRQAIVFYDRARECAVLWFAEVQRRALYRELGYASLQIYAIQALRFSENRYRQFKRLADDLARLPRLRTAVEDGEIGWTKAQVVARVATPTNEVDWVRTARTMGRRELAEQVRQARGAARRQRATKSDGTADLGLDAGLTVDGGRTGAAAPPATCLNVRLDSVQLARYEALIEQVRKRGLVPRAADRAEILLAALEALVTLGRNTGPDSARRPTHGHTRAPVQIVVRQCPDCERMAAVTSRGEKELTVAQAEALTCDAQVRDGPSGRNRATIPPAVRVNVLARDGHRCTTPGCGATQFLEVHHVIPRIRGGSNRVENLMTLCSRCHRFAHEREHRSGLSPPAAC